MELWRLSATVSLDLSSPRLEKINVALQLFAEEEQEVMDEFEKLEEEFIVEDLPEIPLEPVIVEKKDEISEEPFPCDEIVLPDVPKTPVQVAAHCSTSERENSIGGAPPNLKNGNAQDRMISLQFIFKLL